MIDSHETEPLYCYRAVQHLEFRLIGGGLAEDIYFAHLFEKIDINRSQVYRPHIAHYRHRAPRERGKRWRKLLLNGSKS